MKTIILILFLLLYKVTIGQNIGPDSGRDIIFANGIRIIIADGPQFDHPANQISLEAWVFPTSTTASSVIISKHHNNNAREYDLGLLPGGIVRFALFDASDVFHLTTSISAVPLNTWTHIAATYANQTARIYINGILDNTNTIQLNSIQSSSIAPLIGSYWLTLPPNTQTRSHFIGEIDEVRIWSIERSQQEIRENMCQSISPTLPGLAGYFPLDEINGATTNNLVDNSPASIENLPTAFVNDRNFSGAPIGNNSSFVYGPFTTTISLSMNGDNFSTNSIALPNNSGIHLFGVNSSPSRSDGLGKHKQYYFGTFLIGSVPAHSLLYEYNNHSTETCTTEFSPRDRLSNATPDWTTPTFVRDDANNLIQLPSITQRTEVILDSICNTSLGIDIKEPDIELPHSKIITAIGDLSETNLEINFPIKEIRIKTILGVEIAHLNFIDDNQCIYLPTPGVYLFTILGSQKEVKLWKVISN